MVCAKEKVPFLRVIREEQGHALNELAPRSETSPRGLTYRILKRHRVRVLCTPQATSVSGDLGGKVHKGPHRATNGQAINLVAHGDTLATPAKVPARQWSLLRTHSREMEVQVSHADQCTTLVKAMMPTASQTGHFAGLSIHKAIRLVQCNVQCALIKHTHVYGHILQCVELDD